MTNGFQMKRAIRLLERCFHPILYMWRTMATLTRSTQRFTELLLSKRQTKTTFSLHPERIGGFGFPSHGNSVAAAVRGFSISRRHQQLDSRLLSSAGATGSSGAGIGNVQDQMLPANSELQTKRLFKHTARPRTVSIIGAPMTFGQPYVGTDHGPKLLREAGLLKCLSSLGWRVNDIPDLDFSLFQPNADSDVIESPDARNSLIVGRGSELLADAVEMQIRNGCFPLVLGGDHSIGIGSLAGILRARPNTGVIWVDAHADLNTPEMSESKNMHGMPVALLMEGMVMDHSKYPGLEWLSATESNRQPPRLNFDQIVYVGLRDVDTEERKTICEQNIKAFTMHDIDYYGIGKVMDMALSHLLEKDSNRPIHLSYDIDAVDPIIAPATGTAVRGGLTYREAHFVAEAAAKSGALASADIVELNPNLSDGVGMRATVELGLGLITSLMGKAII